MESIVSLLPLPLLFQSTADLVDLCWLIRWQDFEQPDAPRHETAARDPLGEDVVAKTLDGSQPAMGDTVAVLSTPHEI